MFAVLNVDMDEMWTSAFHNRDTAESMAIGYARYYGWEFKVVIVEGPTRVH